MSVASFIFICHNLKTTTMALQSALHNRVVQLSISLIVVIFTFLCINPLEWSILHSFEKFSFWLVLGLLSLGLVFFMLNLNKLMFVSFGACAIACLFMNARFDIPLKPAEMDDSPTLRVSYFHIKDSSFQLGALSKQITTKQPHLIALTANNNQLTSDFIHHTTMAGYPHHQQFWASSKERIDIFSIFPLQNMKTISHGNTSSVVGQVVIQANSTTRTLGLISSFLPAPENDQLAVKACEEFEFYLQQTQKDNTPLLLLGDFNRIPWSSELANIRQQSGLYCSNRSILAHTANTKLPYLYIPTEQIFHSSHLRCIEFETEKIGPNDQFGIFGTYQFNSKADNQTHAIKTSQKF